MRPIRGLLAVLALLGALIAVPLGGVVLAAEPASAATGAGSDTLLPGEQLTAGQQLNSADGRYRLIMQGDGNLVLYAPGRYVWASMTFAPGAWMVLQGDGNLVVYSGTNVALWNSATYGQAASSLVLQSDSRLVLYGPAGVLWADPLRDSLLPGEYLEAGGILISGSGRFQLVLQYDGNLVAYGPQGAYWSSQTHGTGASAVAVLQYDGNLVVYAQGRAVWADYAFGSPSLVAVQSDGNVVHYNNPWHAAWAAYYVAPRIGVNLPLAYAGPASQVITVVAGSAAATTATLTAWQRNGDGSWTAVFGPVGARIGAAGIGATSEGQSRTPSGSYTLTQAFGRLANPGTAMPYFQTGPLDWWDANPSSPTYNLHVVQSASPGGASENLYYAGTPYNLAINIDYNLARVPGAGSAFFLHVDTGAPTGGCVAIDQATLTGILQWLNPSYQPAIDLGVG